jgi:hypothetical protein
MFRIEIDMSREWLIMLQDFCVKAEFGQEIPPANVKAMKDFLSALSVNVKEAEVNAKQRV